MQVSQNNLLIFQSPNPRFNDCTQQHRSCSIKTNPSVNILLISGSFPSMPYVFWFIYQFKVFEEMKYRVSSLNKSVSAEFNKELFTPSVVFNDSLKALHPAICLLNLTSLNQDIANKTFFSVQEYKFSCKDVYIYIYIYIYHVFVSTTSSKHFLMKHLTVSEYTSMSSSDAARNMSQSTWSKQSCSIASDWSDRQWIVLRAGASRFSFCL